MIFVDINNPGIILLIIVAIAAALGGIAYAIYRLTHKKSKEEKPKEEDTAKEELDRILEPIDDEKVSEDIQNYKSPEDDK